MTDTEKLNLINSILDSTIETQETQMKIADYKNNSSEWLKAYDIIGLCLNIKDIIDEKIDLIY